MATNYKNVLSTALKIGAAAAAPIYGTGLMAANNAANIVKRGLSTIKTATNSGTTASDIAKSILTGKTYNKAPGSYTIGTKQNSDLSNVDTANAASSLTSSILGGSGGSSGSSGGGGYAARIDLTPLINTYNSSRDASKQAVNAAYESSRNQLSQQLKEYQEQNAKDKQTQINSFNSARADLENQAYMNNRTAQQSAAARGLSGSGLQQLAQLQAQIESGEQTNVIAKENENTLTNLSDALKSANDNYTQNINNLNNQEKSELASIESDYANRIAEAQYNEEVRYQNALAEAAALSASYANNASNEASEYNALYSDVINELKGKNDQTLTKAKTAIDKLIKTKSSYKSGKEYQTALDNAYDKYYKTITNRIADYGALGDYNNQIYNYYIDQLNKAYNTAAGSTVYKKYNATGGYLKG